MPTCHPIFFNARKCPNGRCPIFFNAKELHQWSLPIILQCRELHQCIFSIPRTTSVVTGPHILQCQELKQWSLSLYSSMPGTVPMVAALYSSMPRNFTNGRCLLFFNAGNCNSGYFSIPGTTPVVTGPYILQCQELKQWPLSLYSSMPGTATVDIFQYPEQHQWSLVPIFSNARNCTSGRCLIFFNARSCTIGRCPIFFNARNWNIGHRFLYSSMP